MQCLFFFPFISFAPTGRALSRVPGMYVFPKLVKLNVVRAPADAATPPPPPYISGETSHVTIYLYFSPQSPIPLSLSIPTLVYLFFPFTASASRRASALFPLLHLFLNSGLSGAQSASSFSSFLHAQAACSLSIALTQPSAFNNSSGVSLGVQYVR